MRDGAAESRLGLIKAAAEINPACAKKVLLFVIVNNWFMMMGLYHKYIQALFRIQVFYKSVTKE